jgi:hypothetical protein
MLDRLGSQQIEVLMHCASYGGVVYCDSKFYSDDTRCEPTVFFLHSAAFSGLPHAR